MVWLLRLVTFVGLWVLVLSGRFDGPEYEWQMCLAAACLCAMMLEQLEQFGLNSPEINTPHSGWLHHLAQLNAYVCVAMAISLVLQNTLFHVFLGTGIALVVLNVALSLSGKTLPEDDE